MGAPVSLICSSIHLLIPVTEQIEQAFKKKNKENQIKSIPTRYDF